MIAASGGECDPKRFKLAKTAERHWRRLNGPDRLAEVVRGVRFRDGEAVTVAEDQAA